MGKKKKLTRTKKTEEVREMSGALAICRGLAIAYALTCVVFILFALLLTYTGLSEGSIPVVSIVCTVVAALLAGLLTAKGVKKSGLVWGLAAGLCYSVILFLIGLFLGEGFALNMSSLTTFVLALAGGGIGGIVGVNL